MPLHVIRGPTAPLFAACCERFLTETAQATAAHSTSYLWVTHRLHRDALLEYSETRGVRGWLAQPLSFFSKLPQQFGITGTPIGLLTRRRLISRLAAHHGRSLGIAVNEAAGAVRGHMLDSLIGELLPEGVSPDRLAAVFTHFEQDDFAARRNRWIHDVYTEYLAELESRGVYDARSIHSLIANAIDAGMLRAAIRGATTLHVYGLYSLRTRHALVSALSRQTDVQATLYVPQEAREFTDIGEPHTLHSPTPELPTVQPAPDPLRESQWVAGRVKQLLIDGAAEPHEIAIVARSGRQDTRRACAQLTAAGVPYSARVRRGLAEIPVVALVLEIFRGAADGWSFATMRTVAGSSYTNAHVTTRALGVIAERSRPRTLCAWEEQLLALHAAIVRDDDRDLKHSGLYPDRLLRDIDRMAKLRSALEPLDSPRTERGWVDATREWLRADPLSLRRRLSRPPQERYDVVRFDQRGLTRLAALLAEWIDVADDERVLDASSWYRLLSSLLAGEELALSTPGQKGVQVLEAHDAALVPFRHTFVVHVNDGEFPARRSVGGVITDEERAALRAAGLPLEDHASALLREHALWSAVTASDNVIATYRTTDPLGTPLLPSLLLPTHDATTELPRSLEIRSGLHTAEQARQAAIETLLAQPDSPAITAEHAITRRAIVAAHAEQTRGAPGRTTIDVAHQDSPWNGVLRDPAVLAVLETHFGPEYPWSASQLQNYARCPLFFLLDRVLYLSGNEEAEEETDALTFGGIVHDILERFYTPYASAGSMPRIETLDAAIAAEIAERENSGKWLGSPALWKITCSSVRRVLTEYVEWELGYMQDKGERPVHCELVIGGETPATLKGQDAKGHDVELRINGRIDRVDVDRNGNYLVLDYKTGKIPSKGGYADGSLLQAVLYTEALRQVMNMRTAAGGRYRALKKPGDPANGAAVKSGSKEYEAALRAMFSVPARVRAGRFEVVMAGSSKWEPYDPDACICRTRAKLTEGSRFDG